MKKDLDVIDIITDAILYPIVVSIIIAIGICLIFPTFVFSFELVINIWMGLTLIDLVVIFLFRNIYNAWIKIKK